MQSQFNNQKQIFITSEHLNNVNEKGINKKFNYFAAPGLNIVYIIDLNQKIATIVNEILRSHGFEMFSDIDCKSRKREKVVCRQHIMYMLPKYNVLTNLTKIGELFPNAGGHRVKFKNGEVRTLRGFDHSTVIHAKNTIQDLIDTDKRFRSKNEIIEMVLNDILKNTKVVNKVSNDNH